MLKVKAFRIQGIKNIEIGNEATVDGDGNNITGSITIHSRPKKVEFSCSDGNDWYAIKDGSNPPRWEKLEELM